MISQELTEKSCTGKTPFVFSNHPSHLVYIISGRGSRSAGRRGNRRVPVGLAAALDRTLSVVEGPRPDVGVQGPISLPQRLGDPLALRLDLGALLAVWVADPFPGRVLKLLDLLSALGLQAVPGHGVLHLVVLAGGRLDVLVLPVLVAVELLDKVVWGDELLELGAVVGKVNLGRNDRVQPSTNNLPDALYPVSCNSMLISSGSHTLEQPGGAVHQDSTKTLGVVGLETLDHELDRGVVHVSHGEARHVKDNTLRWPLAS